MKRHILFAFGLLLILSCFILAQSPANSNDQQGYLLGPGDKIQVKVLGEKDFDFDTEIAPNGKFVVPFVEDEPVEAACRTETELRKEVAERYAKYLKNPMVSLTVTQRRKSAPVTIYGEVANQQQIQLTRPATLWELIAFSGGIKQDSAGGTVQVVRTKMPLCAEKDDEENWNIESNDGKIHPSRMYSLSSVMTGKKEANPQIFAGDIIFIEKAPPVYIIGEIGNATGIRIKEGGLSLSTALAMAGGTREKAKIKDIKIYRRKESDPLNPDIISVNYKEIKEGKQKDIMLQPYDVIDIAKKKKGIGEILFETITGATLRGAQTLVTGGARNVVY
jgi:polysaccharide export outer membrane protein